MEKLLNELKETLKQDDRLFAEDKLLKNKAIERALDNDEKLLELLASNERLKEHFFTEAGEHLVFDEEKFAQFVSNKQFLPDSYTAFKNKVGLKQGKEHLQEKEEIELAWPYKDCVLEGGQTKEDEGRDEKFWNKTLAPDQVDKLLNPKVLSDFKRVTEDGEEEVEEITENDNLFLRGNNLLALNSLVDRYAGEVKLIYIDPPYNTGSDNFKYNDSFNESSWLTFMKNRLEAAKELLSEDGVIFVHIDDNELAPLKLLMDEIFGEAPSGKENFVQYVQIKANEGAANEYQNPFMPKNCEYGLVYAKNYDEREYKPIWVKSEVDEAYNKFILNPEEDYHNWEISTVKSEFKDREGKNWSNASSEEHYEFVIDHIDQIFRKISPKGPGKGLKEAMEKSDKKTWAKYEREDKKDILCYEGGMVRFYSENLKEDINGDKIIATELGSLWTDISWTGIANEGGVKLKGGKKPERLLRRIIYQNTDEEDLVLDFFLGSGTTAAVAHKMNRQYIGIEQLDYGNTDPTVRLENVINGDTTGISKPADWEGGGDFVYAELMQWNAEFIERIDAAEDSEELQDVWSDMKDQAFLSCRIDVDEFEENAEEFEDLELEKQKEFLKEILDNNQLYVNYSEIEDSDYEIDEETIELNKQFYNGE